MSLNISHFNLFFMWKLQPPPLHRKKSPTSFPVTPLKSWGSVSQALPFWKFGRRFNPPPSAEKGRCTLWPMCFVAKIAVFYSIGRNICSLKLYLFIKLFSTLTFLYWFFMFSSWSTYSISILIHFILRNSYYYTISYRCLVFIYSLLSLRIHWKCSIRSFSLQVSLFKSSTRADTLIRC